ncbi:aldo/keto reductase [Steroidobacter sp. S1-65]|uniref:Aldo/keto reductase n=1 Tax=Steroidobacter gossypii TaxID=2805490 RepID=A0ABS1WTH1_9GAMM|nr:aldo/keto reductase [Steroidobacter gossypii]MBM0104270.1 aldo/keto reductase [Steroidobacter gossypii]
MSNGAKSTADRTFSTGAHVSRRAFLGGTLASGLLSAAPLTALAQESNTVTKTARRINTPLPAIGLGTFLTFDALPGQSRAHLAEVMRRFWAAGGRVIDTSPLYGMGEVNVGDFAAALGIGDRLFITNKVWSTGEFLGDDSHARRSLDVSMQRLWRERIDVMQCHSLVNADVVVPLLNAWKAEGKIGHVGVSHHEPDYFSALARWVQRDDIDVVQVHYSIHTRQAEERILPAAAERGIAVLVNMPFEKARLFSIVAGRALPDFAREIGAENWAQFFLKWVVSHPAVTCALPATSNPEHLSQNMGALRGPLPDREMRARMVRYMESMPGFATLAAMPPYPNKQYTGVITRAQRALRKHQQ